MIEIILVLYKRLPQQSQSYVSIRKYIHCLHVPYSIIIYNNTPDIEITSSHPDEIIINATGNDMLAGAYNKSLELAKKSKCDWILLLDQDTELNETYFREVNAFLTSEDANHYAIAAPVLCKDDIHLSPVAFNPAIGPFWAGRNFNITHSNFKNIPKGMAPSAFNSAVLLKVEAIESIGGFDNDFPLDMLDHRYFYQLYKAGLNMYVLDVTMTQNLSLLDNKDQMPVSRYREYLKACRLFSKKIGWRTLVSQKLRLCLHIGSQIIRPNKRKYLKSSLKELILI